MKFLEISAKQEELESEYIKQMFLVIRIMQWIYDLCIISLFAASIQLRQIVRFLYQLA